MGEIFEHGHENRYEVEVRKDGLVQGSVEHDLDDVEMEQRRTADGGEMRSLHASGNQVARASSSNQEAYEEVGEIFEAVREARKAREADETAASPSDVEAIAVEAMEQTGEAIELANDAGDAAMAALDKGVKAINRVEELAEEVDKAKRSGGGGTITIETDDPDTEPAEIDGLVHKRFKDLLTYIAKAMHVLLVGGAGTGKTHGAKQAASATGREIEVFRGHKHAVADDLYGFVSTVDGKFIPGPAYHAVKEGKVLYVDEFDVCTPAFIKGANNLTDDSEYVQFPNGERVEKHEDFVFLASANTVGQGATEKYTGASGQLDASSIDRLAFLEWGIDENIEETLAEAHAGEAGLKWASYVQEVREAVGEAMSMPIEITPRATIDGAKMIAGDDHFDEEMAREAQITGKMTEEQMRQVHDALCFEEEDLLPDFEDIADEMDFDEGGGDDDDLPW